jgi:hypothetical protein
LTPFPSSSSSHSCRLHSLLRYSDLATVVLPRPRAQLPPPARLVLAPPLHVVLLRHMRIKSLCHIRSTANPNREMAVETACVLDPQAAWVRSTMTEAKIQALVDRGLLRPKTEVEWRAAAKKSSRVRTSRSRSYSLPSSSAASTSRREISSVACCTTTGWSWYTSFQTPSCSFNLYTFL